MKCTISLKLDYFYVLYLSMKYTMSFKLPNRKIADSDCFTCNFEHIFNREELGTTQTGAVDTHRR